MKNWLRNKLREFLGIDSWVAEIEAKIDAKEKSILYEVKRLHQNLTGIGIDVNVMHDPTTIVIISKLNGGQVKIIETGINDQRHLRSVIEQVEAMYGNNNKVYDMPRGLRL